MTITPVRNRDAGAGEGIVPLDANRHAGLGIKRSQLRHFMAARNAVPVCIAEFFYAARHYPIVFVKDSAGAMCASAITGLRQHENLFVDARGDWREQVYVPAWIRRFPFYSAEGSDAVTPDRKMILVDEAGLEPSGEPFFDSAGEETEKWKATRELLADYIAAERLTLAFAARMLELDLLEAFDAQINPERQDRMQVTGMYRIDENRLNRLPAKTIRELMRRGEMSRIYAHLISLENFAKLLDLSAAAE
jgi:hypothetical protein